MAVSSEKRSCFFFTTHLPGLFQVYAGWQVSPYLSESTQEPKTLLVARRLWFSSSRRGLSPAAVDRISTTRSKRLKLPVLEPSCPFRPQVCVSVPNRQAPKSSCWSMGILKGRLIEDERWASQLL